MDQRSICMFLAMKQLLAQAIHSKLVAVLGPDAIAYSTVIKYLRQRQFPSIPCEAPDEHPATVIDNAILDALDKQPFSSVQELAQLTCIPRSTLSSPSTPNSITWVCSKASSVDSSQSHSGSTSSASHSHK
jgi:hypothetical protein